MAIRWTDYGRLSLTCLLRLRAFEIDSQKVDESTGLFHSSDANKIITGQVNFSFIGPHSGASLWRFPPNHFCLRNEPRSTTCTMVFIPQPPFISNYRATSRSRSIIDCRSISPLFLSHWIKWHIPNSAERPGLNQRASLRSGFIHNRRCNPPYFSAIRSNGTYSIPPGSFVLTNAQVHKAEFTHTVDLIKLDQRPLISILH